MTSKVEESSHIINVRVFTFLHILAKLIILRCYKFFDQSQIVFREFFSEISQNTSCLCKIHERRKPHEWHSFNAISLDFRMGCVVFGFSDFWTLLRILLGCKCFDKSRIVCREKLYEISQNNSVWGKTRKVGNRLEIEEYWQISPDFRSIWLILRFFDFWVFLRIILACQCFDKSLNVRRIRQISLNLDLNVWF